MQERGFVARPVSVEVEDTEEVDAREEGMYLARFSLTSKAVSKTTIGRHAPSRHGQRRLEQSEARAVLESSSASRYSGSRRLGAGCLLRWRSRSGHLHVRHALAGACDHGTDQVYFQKQPGTVADQVNVTWNDGFGHTYNTSGEFGQDLPITPSLTGVTIAAGHPAQATLPSLSLLADRPLAGSCGRLPTTSPRQLGRRLPPSW